MPAGVTGGRLLLLNLQDETTAMIHASASRAFLIGVVGLGISAGGADAVRAQSNAPPNAVVACEPCHGRDGIGRDIETPNIAGQHSIYLRNAMLAFKNGQRKHPDMRYMARELSGSEIEQLVVYYSTLLPD